MRVQVGKYGAWAVGLVMMSVVMANEKEMLDAVSEGELGRVRGVRRRRLFAISRKRAGIRPSSKPRGSARLG